VLLVAALIPPGIMAEHRAAAELAEAQPKSAAGTIVIAAIWIALSAVAGWLAYRWLTE